MSWSWKKRKAKSAQEALLSAIWRKYGGLTSVAHALGLKIQAPANWRNRNAVPLSMCPKVAKKLRLNNIQTLGLNYNGIKEFNVPSRGAKWEDIVKSFNFSLAEENYILSLPVVELSGKKVK